MVHFKFASKRKVCSIRLTKKISVVCLGLCERIRIQVTLIRTGENPRLLGTYEFLNQIVKAGGKESKHEVSAFHQRWIIGRGCPLLIAGLRYDSNNRCWNLCCRTWQVHERPCLGF